MRSKWVYSIIMITLITLSSYSILSLGHSIDSDLSSKERIVLDVAVNLATPSSDAQLMRFDMNYDFERNRYVWYLEWMINNALICVEVDDKSLEILYYLDTSKTSQSKTISDMESTNPEVVNEVQRLILSMSSYGIQILPSDANILNIERTTCGWNVVWGHEIDSVPIKFDEISITVDVRYRKVLSYKKVWNDIQINTKPSISQDEMNHILRSLLGNDISIWDSELVIVNNYEIGDYYLAYDVTISDIYGKSVICKIDAHTGDLIDYDMIMGYQDVYVNIAFSSDLGVSTSVFRRLDSSTTDPARFYVDVGRDKQKRYLSYEELFYNMGHGYYVDVGGGVLYSTIVTPTGDITTSDILYYSLSNMKLAFLASCVAFPGDFFEVGRGWLYITYGIANAFLDAGADCVFGWVGTITASQNWEFTQSFFDKAVNGFDFDACFQYARNRIWSSERPKAKIEGDTSLTLSRYDQGSDSYLGTYLGCGSAIEWNIDYEGLWGIGIDIDNYRFLVSGTRRISIYVLPIYSFDVVFKVYDCYMNLKYTVNYNGYGQSEYISFTGSSTYYVKVYATGSGHGGIYDITISITSS